MSRGWILLWTVTTLACTSHILADQNACAQKRRQLENTSLTFNNTYEARSGICRISHFLIEPTTVCAGSAPPFDRYGLKGKTGCSENVCPPTFSFTMTNVTKMTHAGTYSLIVNNTAVDCFQLSIYRRDDLVLTLQYSDLAPVNVTPEDWSRPFTTNTTSTDGTGHVRVTLGKAAPSTVSLYINRSDSSNLSPAGSCHDRLCPINFKHTSATTTIFVDFEINGLEDGLIPILQIESSISGGVSEDPILAVWNWILIAIVVAGVVCAIIVILVIRKMPPSDISDNAAEEFRKAIDKLRNADGKDADVQVFCKKMANLIRNPGNGQDNTESLVTATTRTLEKIKKYYMYLAAEQQTVLYRPTEPEEATLVDNLAQTYTETVVDILTKRTDEIEELILDMDVPEKEAELVLAELSSSEQKYRTAVIERPPADVERCLARYEEVLLELQDLMAFAGLVEDNQLLELFTKDLPSRADLKQQLAVDALDGPVDPTTGEDIGIRTVWLKRHPRGENIDFHAACRFALAYQAVTSRAKSVSIEDFRLLHIFADYERRDALSITQSLPDAEIQRLCKLMKRYLVRKGDQQCSEKLAYVTKRFSVLDLDNIGTTDQFSLNADTAKYEALDFSDDSRLRDTLKNLFRDSETPEDVQHWIENNVMLFRTRDPVFIRALTEAVLESAVNDDSLGRKCEEYIRHWGEKLLCPLTRDHSNEVEVLCKVEVLFAVQDFARENNKRNILDQFLAICGDVCISKDPILEWVVDPRNRDTDTCVQAAKNIKGIKWNQEETEKIADLDGTGGGSDLNAEVRYELLNEIPNKTCYTEADIQPLQAWLAVKFETGDKGLIRQLVVEVGKKVKAGEFRLTLLANLLPERLKTVESLEILDGLLVLAKDDPGSAAVTTLITEVATLVDWSIVVRWLNQDRRTHGDPSRVRKILKGLPKAHEAQLRIWNLAAGDSESALIIKEMHKSIPLEWLGEFGKKLVLRVVKGARLDTDSDQERFDLMKLYNRIPLLWSVHRHRKESELDMIESIMTEGSPQSPLLSSPWYPYIVKVLLFGGAFSARAMLDSHRDSRIIEICEKCVPKQP